MQQLYKFTTLSRLEQSLGMIDMDENPIIKNGNENDYLWFSKPELLNDPFDCYLNNLFEFEHLNTFYKSLGLIDSHQQEDFLGILKNIGILSLSSKLENLTMWALYAESYQGACMVLDCEKLKQSLNSLLHAYCGPFEAFYRDSPIPLTGPRINPHFDLGIKSANPEVFLHLHGFMRDPRHREELFKALYTQKHKDTWKNEHEFRMIIMPGGLREARKFESGPGYKINVLKDCLRGIVFGHRVKEARMEKISTEVKKHYGNDLKMEIVSPNNKEWKLDFNPI